MKTTLDQTWFAAALVCCIALFVTVSSSSCSLLRGACADALPVIAASQVYAQDATVALDQAEQLLPALPITEAQKKELQDAINKARSALRSGQQLLVVASDACSKPDVGQVFAEFVQAWGIIETFLAKQPPASMGAAPATMTVQTPAIVLKSRAHVVAP